MLKLLAFVEKSDTKSKIKGENNDAIKSMDAAIKAQLPQHIKKTKNQERAQNWEGKVNEFASQRFKRRSFLRPKNQVYRDRDRDLFFDIGKPGPRVPLGRTDTVYLPPEHKTRPSVIYSRYVPRPGPAGFPVDDRPDPLPGRFA